MNIITQELKYKQSCDICLTNLQKFYMNFMNNIPNF